MPPIETQKSFVNTWECDENDHMNVQFYWQRFDHGGRMFLCESGLERVSLGRAIRVVRYHAERRSADLVAIRSGVVAEHPFPLTIVHDMIDPISGTRIATAFDGHMTPDNRAAAGDFPSFDGPVPAAMPRSVPIDRPDPLPTLAEASRAGAVTYRGLAEPALCNRDGTGQDRLYISAVTDAATFLWEYGGLTKAHLDRNGLGRVAVETSLQIVDPYQAEDLMTIVSTITAAHEKTFSFRHHLFDARTQRIKALVDVTGLMMDLETRRAVPIPQPMREQLAALIP